MLSWHHGRVFKDKHKASSGTSFWTKIIISSHCTSPTFLKNLAAFPTPFNVVSRLLLNLYDHPTTSFTAIPRNCQQQLREQSSSPALLCTCKLQTDAIAQLNYWLVFTTSDLTTLVSPPVLYSNHSLALGLVPIWPEQWEKWTNSKLTFTFSQPVQLPSLVIGECLCERRKVEHSLGKSRTTPVSHSQLSGTLSCPVRPGPGALLHSAG